jgi:Ni/Co efflux regulator RcnB
MKLIHRLLIAVALCTASFGLFAQDHGRGHGNHDRGHYGHDRGHDRGHDNRHWHGNDHRRYGYHRPPPRYYGHSRYYGHPHRWERGHRYYGPTYVVSNYGYYRLRPPPRGYHWVRADNQYLLVAIATGVILDIALH